MIQCICSYFNFFNDEKIKKNYFEFRKKFKHNILTLECSLNNFVIEDSIKIKANSANILWQKERCFNILLNRIDDKVDKIIWLDTDIIFQDENWISEAEKLLDNYCFIQPFSQVFEKNNQRTSENTILNCNSYAKCLRDKIDKDFKIPNDKALGLTWGIRREFLKNGFFDKHILGNNDSIQLCAFKGDYFNKSITVYGTNGLKKEFIKYVEKLPDFDINSFSYCKGKIEHIYHGKILNRGYLERELLLKKLNYEPLKDISIDKNGLYKIESELMNKELIKYFLRRTNLD